MQLYTLGRVLLLMPLQSVPSRQVVVRLPVRPESSGGKALQGAGNRPELKCLPDVLTPTIFHEAWWLDTVTDGNFGLVECRLGGAVVGRLPYVMSRFAGMLSIGMPTLTHFLGPAIDYGPGGATTRLLRGMSITRELIEALPKTSSVWMKLHGGIGDTVAFQEAGFNTNVQFTSEIAPASEDVLWRAMRDKTRNVIRRAQEQLHIVTETDPERFIAFYIDNLKRDGLRSDYHFDTVKAVMDQCLRRGVGEILLALDRYGKCKSGIFTVWDARSRYYLMSTRAKDGGNGAVSALIWSAIKGAASDNVVFDFDGARHAGDTRFFAGFGGVLKPRYWVWRSNRFFRAAGYVSSLLKKRAQD